MYSENSFDKHFRNIRRKKRRHGRGYKIVCAGFFLILALFWFYKFSLVNPVDAENSNPVMFKIDAESPPREIARKLEEAQLIRSDLSFYLYVKNNDLAPHIKAGSFMLAKNKSAIEISKIITENPKEIVFLIPEGFTIRDIDHKLRDYGLIREGDFVKKTQSVNPLLREKYNFLVDSKSLEGYLFPDTYFIDGNNFDSAQFVDRLLKNFEKKAMPEIAKYRSLSNRSLDEIINMASIIEKEVRTSKDRAIVAGILWKRLDANWLLGADATILYVTEKTTVSAKDLELNSSYNTRKKPGLPPTAIGNPGLDAIRAVLIPKASEYWYYLTPPNSDTVIYAVTNEEHNQNKARYL